MPTNNNLVIATVYERIETTHQASFMVQSGGGSQLETSKRKAILVITASATETNGQDFIKNIEGLKLEEDFNNLISLLIENKKSLKLDGVCDISYIRAKILELTGEINEKGLAL